MHVLNGMSIPSGNQSGEFFGIMQRPECDGSVRHPYVVCVRVCMIESEGPTILKQSNRIPLHRTYYIIVCDCDMFDILTGVAYAS